MSSSLPLRINAQSLVTMKELKNSSSSTTYNLTDDDFETYICRNLANQTAPLELENNYSSPNSLSIVNSNIEHSTIISNNDNILVNENFAMKMNYVTPDGNGGGSGGSGGENENYHYTIGDYIPADVVLDYQNTNSIYSSNIKIDISLNEDTQYTTSNEWAVDYLRAHSNMNYFSCINSDLQDISGISPFYIVESSANIYALGNSEINVATNKYFTREYNGISSSDNSGIMIPHDMCLNSLDYNYCGSYIANKNVTTTGGVAPYAYTFDEFTSFKITQAAPSVDTTVLDSTNTSGNYGANLPVQYNAGDISANTFNFDGVFEPVGINSNVENIGDGFQISITVGSVQLGGYDLSGANDAFSISDANLVRDYNEPYIALDQQKTVHTLTIQNGNVNPTSDYSTNNADFIVMGTEAETLSSPYNTTDGYVDIYVNDVNNRVYYPLTGGYNDIYNNNSGNQNTNMTDYIDVVYNTDEANYYGYDTQLDSSTELLTTENIEYNVKVLAPNTSNYFNNTSDNRNLASNNSAILVVAASAPLASNPAITDFALTSHLPVNDNTIQIVSIENNSVLANQTQLLNPSLNVVSGTSSTVSIQNIDLSGALANYSDYQVKLDTKTISDISGLAQATNGWTFTTNNSTSYMLATPLRTSVLYDDYLFMTNGNHLDVSMNYQFKIANPICTSTQAIKRTVQITFKDLSGNAGYNTSNTVFYLDDQDITITPKNSSGNDVSLNAWESIVEDVSCTNITSLNGSYLVNNYKFKKFISTKYYTATFDAKFPFYTNLMLKTTLICERAEFYKIYDLANNEQPGYLLKYFKCADDDHLLSDVYVNLPGEPYQTNFLLTPEICSIFNIKFLGKDRITDVYGQVTGSNVAYLDPFFKLTSQITGSASIGSVNVTVKFNNNIFVDQSYYTIETQNAPGTNISLSAKKYVYNLSSNGSELDGFTPYNDFYNTLSGMTNIRVVVTNDISGNQTATIYDTNNTTVLATIQHPYNFINNYNIIVGSSTYVQTKTYYDGVLQSTIRSLALNDTVHVDSGVYLHLNSFVDVGQEETFKLMTDGFDFRFVDNNSYPNNLDYLYYNTIPFTDALINTVINCDSMTTEHARSILFTRLRGWTNTYDNYDWIILSRTSANYVFSMHLASTSVDVSGTTATQDFSTQVYVGQTLTVNHVVGTYATYNLGLELLPSQSILAVGQQTVYTIYASVADMLVNIDSNPYNPNLIGVLKYGYVTDNAQDDLLYPYISGVKASGIKTDQQYTIRIKRNVPDLHVYSLVIPNFISDPRQVTTDASWNELGTVAYNVFSWVGYVASNLNVHRRNTHIMFYNSYSSYYVVAPPCFSVYGYKQSKDVRTVPIYGRGTQSNLFRTFDVNNPENSYVITSTTISSYPLTIRQPTPLFSYARYLDNTSRKYNFRIQGNKISIAIYNAGTGAYGSPQSPVVADATNSPLEYIYPYVNPYNGKANINNISSVSGVFTVTQDANLDYTISYNQILAGGSTHNASQNIIFKIGNAFNGIPPSGSNGYPSMYLRLNSSQGTTVAFYQANLIYADASGGSLGNLTSGYYMVIDKYTTDSTIDYNAILTRNNIREVFFPVASHYSKVIALSNTIVDGNGNIITEDAFVGAIADLDISTSSWVQDNAFTLQYIGLTISALNNTGKSDISALLKYNSDANLQSKSLYVQRQDVVRVKNAIGNTIFRVTNSGNVQSQRLTTAGVSLYYPEHVAPETIGTSIGGASDLISLFAQNTLMDDQPN